MIDIQKKSDKRLLCGFERLHWVSTGKANGHELNELLAKSFSASLLVEEIAEVNAAFVDVTTWGEFLDFMGNPLTAFWIGVEGIKGDVIVNVDPSIISKGEGPGVRLCLDYLGKRIGKDLERAWAPLQPIQVRSIECCQDKDALPAWSVEKIVVLMGLEVSIGMQSGSVVLGYNADSLETIGAELETYWYSNGGWSFE